MKKQIVHTAIKGEHDEAFGFLLRTYTDRNILNHQNMKGVTALAVAAHKGRKKVGGEVSWEEDPTRGAFAWFLFFLLPTQIIAINLS